MHSEFIEATSDIAKRGRDGMIELPIGYTLRILRGRHEINGRPAAVMLEHHLQRVTATTRTSPAQAMVLGFWAGVRAARVTAAIGRRRRRKRGHPPESGND